MFYKRPRIILGATMTGQANAKAHQLPCLLAIWCSRLLSALFKFYGLRNFNMERGGLRP